MPYESLSGDSLTAGQLGMQQRQDAIRLAKKVEESPRMAAEEIIRLRNKIKELNAILASYTNAAPEQPGDI